MTRLQNEYDLIIAGGVILDGLVDEPFSGDVAICDDRIAAVGDLSGAHAARRIEAHGKRVAPGFIDIHTHSDISVAFHQPMLSMISQGVTTQVAGNCSLSLGLARNTDDFAFERRWLASHGAQIVWDDMAGHLQHVRDIGVATNYVMLAGHGTIRKRVMGMADRRPVRSELEAMKRELALALEQGAWGLSTGLEYTPSGYANVAELVALSSVMRRFGGLYATHLRNEGDELLEAVEEALAVGEGAGVPVQLSHHKAEGRQNWGKVHQTARLVEAARDRGVDVEMDVYPYTAFMTNLSVQLLPRWALAGDDQATLRRLRDPETRQRIVRELLEAHPDWSDESPQGHWGRIEIAIARRDRSLQGKTIAEIAGLRGANPVDAALDLIAEQDNFVAALSHAISDDDVSFVMRRGYTMIGSDAVGTGPDGRTGEERVHPRCYGTFPRVLGRYAREAGVLSEAEAIRKMTSRPARRLGLEGRGSITVGNFADIVVYDPMAVADRATYADPHRHSAGIETVIVNGRIVWDGSTWTGALPGRVLGRPR